MMLLLNIISRKEMLQVYIKEKIVNSVGVLAIFNKVPPNQK